MRTFGIFVLGWGIGVFMCSLLILTASTVQRRRAHIHEWSPWTEWIGFHDRREGETWWKRQRRCRTCGRVAYERAGRHTCFEDSDKCSHREALAVTFDEDYAVKKMEKDMGIGGSE